MKRIRFLFYYFFRVISVSVGLRQTLHPLNIKWRWQHWRKAEDKRREKRR